MYNDPSVTPNKPTDKCPRCDGTTVIAIWEDINDVVRGLVEVVPCPDCSSQPENETGNEETSWLPLIG